MKLKETPEDFVVEEIPLYEASGAGEHLYVTFTKTDLTTDEAARALARVARVAMRDVGIAGVKDKRAVTTQTISLLAAKGAEDAIASAEIPGVRLVAAKRHGNKLRTGHLRGNRFRIVARDVDAAAVAERLRRIGTEGLPNAYGEQRFAGDNAARALACARGEAPWPRDPRRARFLFSALQSALFNQVLARRVADGTWAVPLVGDLLRKSDSGGIFPCEDAAADGARAARFEVSPTGPMFGARMPEPTPGSAPFELERAVREAGLPGVDLAALRGLGEGARRPLRIEVAEVEAIVRDERTLEAGFVLPRGAYATTVLATAAGVDASHPSPEHDEPDD